MLMMMLLMMLSAATTVQTRFDASTLHDCPRVAMETGMVDDGSGSKQVNTSGTHDGVTCWSGDCS